MKRLSNVHPGSVLKEEFMIPFEISTARLAKDLYIPRNRVSGILKGNRSVTADTALRLSKYFGNSHQFWLGLQMDFDVEEVNRVKKVQISAIKKYSRRAA